MAAGWEGSDSPGNLRIVRFSAIQSAPRSRAYDRLPARRYAVRMNRRSFLTTTALAGTAALPPRARAAIPKMKITRVRIYTPPDLNPLFNQSNMVVTVETDAGLTGVGEGGSKDTLEQCAGRLIGRDPQRIEHLWQD